MQLARIVGRIVHHFQKLDEPAQYSDVEKLQRELEVFVENLPPHFRMYMPDKSRDSSESRARRCNADSSFVLATGSPFHAIERDSCNHDNPSRKQPA